MDEIVCKSKWKNKFLVSVQLANVERLDIQFERMQKLTNCARMLSVGQGQIGCSNWCWLFHPRTCNNKKIAPNFVSYIFGLEFSFFANRTTNLNGKSRWNSSPSYYLCASKDAKKISEKRICSSDAVMIHKLLLTQCAYDIYSRRPGTRLHADYIEY